MKLSKTRAMEAIRQLLKLHKTRSGHASSRGNMYSAMHNLEELGYASNGFGGYTITPEGDVRAIAILEASGIEVKI